MRPSWFRELISSFRKTLRRWYCAVRALMNSCAHDGGPARAARPGSADAVAEAEPAHER
jgi:hypothetical protein